MVSQNLLCYFSLVILCFFRVNTQKDKKTDRKIKRDFKKHKNINKQKTEE